MSGTPETHLSLAKRIEAELRVDNQGFDIHPDTDGYVNEQVSMDTQSFFIEFKVTGWLKFYFQSWVRRNPEDEVPIEYDLCLEDLAIYDENGQLIDTDNEKDFQKEMEELLLGIFLNH